MNSFNIKSKWLYFNFKNRWEGHLDFPLQIECLLPICWQPWNSSVRRLSLFLSNPTVLRSKKSLIPSQTATIDLPAMISTLWWRPWCLWCGPNSCCKRLIVFDFKNVLEKVWHVHTSRVQSKMTYDAKKGRQNRAIAYAPSPPRSVCLRLIVKPRTNKIIREFQTNSMFDFKHTLLILPYL